MVNPQKIKGSAYERTIVDYLRKSGFMADRTRAGWVDDRGDIHGVTSAEGKPFTFECKNHRGDSLPGWIKELQREVSNAGGVVGVVVHKRHGTADAGDQFCTLPMSMLVQLLKEAGYK
jgi:Holliday junction resolvase